MEENWLHEMVNKPARHLQKYPIEKEAVNV